MGVVAVATEVAELGKFLIFFPNFFVQLSGCFRAVLRVQLGRNPQAGLELRKKSSKIEIIHNEQKTVLGFTSGGFLLLGF